MLGKANIVEAINPIVCLRRNRVFIFVSFEVSTVPIKKTGLKVVHFKPRF